MRGSNVGRILRSSVALGALTVCSSAYARCTTANGLVTCTEANTSDQVNGAIVAASPPSVTLVIAPGATVTRGSSTQIGTNGAPFSGAIGYVNDGVVGAPGAPVDFRSVGTLLVPTNTANLTNRGVQNGSVSARFFGGAVNVVNSGTITGGVEVRADGPITFSNTGSIYNTDTSGLSAINLVSTRLVSADSQGGTYELGSTVTATIGGTVAQPATSTVAARPQVVFINAAGGADVTVTGQAGQVSASSQGAASSFTSTNTPSGGTLTLVQTNDQRSTGGDVRALVGASGGVTSLGLVSTNGTVTAIVNGQVLRDTGPGFGLGEGGVGATSNGNVSSSRQTDVRDAGTGFTLSSSSSSTGTNTGKAALVEIGATGRTSGSVSARSNAGNATVLVAGIVGDPTTGGVVSATSTGSNFTSERASTNRPDGSFQSTGNSTRSASGGVALVSVAATGTAGGVTAVGDAGATVNTAGRLRGGAEVTSGGQSLTTSEVTNQSRSVVTDASAVRTVADQTTINRTTETQGGAAALTNAASGSIEGGIRINGVRGASVDTAGTIAGGVSLRTFGNRTVVTEDSRSTTVTTPASGGGTTTSATQTSSTSSATRATGGATSGRYGGEIGTATPTTPGGAGVSAAINQNGMGGSSAEITGTAFSIFSGIAGATNEDFSSTTSSRVVTAASGASTREQSSTSAQTVTQVASASTLTITAGGRLADNGSGTGSATVESAGGDAVFTLDGGRVDGLVRVTAGAGLDRVQTSTAASSFTRAAASSGIPAAEIQQSQTTSTNSEQRAVRGVVTATVRSGTVGGDLLVQGTGAGVRTVGASAVIDGTVTGKLFVRAAGSDVVSTSSDVATRTGANAITRTQTSSSTTSASAQSGNTAVTVNGVVGGGVEASAASGAATVTLAGRAGTLRQDGVTVTASGANAQSTQTQVFDSAGFFSANPTVASRFTNASTPTGGVATLNVAPSMAVRTSGASSLEGNVLVQGLAGSALNLAAGSRIAQTVGRVSVGGNLTASSSETNGVFANGVQTGSITTLSFRSVGGPATVVNAGIIGSAANPVLLTVASIGGANATNSGTINGSVTIDARGTSQSTTTTITNFDSFALRRTVTNTVLTTLGGAAVLDNGGLVTGGVTAIGATGTVTNGGVLRSGITLGGSTASFGTTVTSSINPTTGTPVSSTTYAPPEAIFAQSYRVDQNGLLLGGINVTGTTAADPAGTVVRTSNVTAAINLNAGSVTLGNVTATGTTTALTLNGAGFLGVAANDVAGTPAALFQSTPSIARFATIDPTLATASLLSGSRVTGVQTVTKSGDGAFVIVGAPFIAATPATGTTPATAANYTLDVGVLRVSGGELQLGLAGATAGANSFGIRGNVENAANLVLGRRIAAGTQTAVQGITIAVTGNLSNAAVGNLLVGVNPTFIATGGGIVPFAGQVGALVSTGSFVRVDGNLTLGGSVTVQAPGNAIYEAGRAYDLFSVSGTYSNTGTVRSTLNPPFVTFTLTPRSEGGRTVVALDVGRANYDTVATDRNSAAAARALQAAIPGVTSGLRSGVASVQDLASVIALLDTQFTADQSAQAFQQLSSAEFYGSLAAISTTAPFGEATDGLPSPGSPAGIGLWFRPTGQFATFKADAGGGASAIDFDNYGGSVGLNLSTDSGGSFGIAGGYGRLKVRSVGSPEHAGADTYMAGIYGVKQLGALHLSGQAVYGRSDWNATRGLPVFARVARASFNSREIRASLRVAYTVDLASRISLAPFARGELRSFRFGGFDERDAGSIALTVARRSATIWSPEVGLRLAGSTQQDGGIRPFAEASYVVQGRSETDRRVALLGNTANAFVLDGVQPGDHVKAAIGLSAAIGATTVFARGDYTGGGRQQVGAVRGGALLKF